MEKIIIDLEAKTDKAIKGIDKVAESVKDLNKTVTKGNKETSEGLKDVEKSSNLVSKGVKGIGTALKAAGIGLALGLLSQLKEIFEKNQKVADLFGTSFEVVSIMFNDFANFIINNTSGVTDFFKAIFEDPKQALIDFADAFKRNIQERFESYLDTLGFLASAVKKVFSGDFAGALEDVKSAGKESLDVLTGVNNTFDKGTEAVEKIAKATSEYVKETVKAATSNVELEKTARIAEAANQGLIEKFDRQAEQLRQIRDDESKSFEERIKANDELAVLLDKQEEAMLRNGQARINQAAAELSKNKDNIDLQIAYKEALNEQAGIEAQITGFRSEQQTNTNSLLREQKDLQNELALIGKTERDIERIELEQQYEAKKLLIEREITDEAEKKILLEELEIQHKANLKLINDEEVANQKEKADKEIEIKRKTAAAEKAIRDANINNIGAGFALLGQLAGRNKALQAAALIGESAVGIAKTIISTKAANAAVTLKYALLPGGLALAAAHKAANNVSAGIGIAANIAATAKGLSGLKAGGSPPSPSPIPNDASGGGSIPSLPPAFNVVGASDTNQLASAIGGQSQQPVQAFVVSNDVTTAQEMDRNIIEGASI